MTDKQNPAGNRHLTEEQKTAMVSLFDQCHMAELLLTTVRHCADCFPVHSF